MAPQAEGYVSVTHARWLASAPDRGWREQDATLVFADVSGFTAMSEKLARRGKIGAEETTDAVNRVFAGLLKATHDAGGEILKFGGDAVLAHFEGEAHPLRAAAAALSMQAAMRPLRRMKTAAGTVSLRLSAGVASGRAHLFLAGSAPRELIVAGPLATEVVSLESAAEAGQVLAGAGTVAALPERCAGAEVPLSAAAGGADRIASGRLLRSVPLGPTVEIPRVPPGFDPRPALPVHLHDHEPGDGEHRFASIGFVQFRGVGELLERSGAETLARALDEVVGTTSEACLEYGVTFVSTDVDRDAGKIILAAGAPSASADDEDRLLHALRAVVGATLPLPVRAGANRGRIFMVDIGPPERRVWSVMGDAVNLAARVMARAEPGRLLASSSLLERVRDDFARTPVAPFMVKGKAAPVHAEVVGPARGARRVRRGPRAPLVGREPELAAITAMLDRARGGAHVVIELVGEPGIGKSRLVESALAVADGLTVVTVAGGPYAVHSPYRAARAPLRELLGAGVEEDDASVEARLRSRLRQLEPRLEPWLPLIGIPFGLDLPATPETAPLSPEFARARLHAAIGRLIELLLRSRPLLLVIEDAHWLDEATSDLLSYLARQRGARGSCHLLTRRPVADGLSLASEPGALRLELAPLDAGAALQLLHSDDSPLPPGAAETLIERSGGNPLLLEELLSAARAGSALDALPDSVEALVMARIDTLPARDRQILRQAAVLGVRVPTPLLEELLGIDALAVKAALNRLEDFVVAESASSVRFRHALLRDAAYEALPFRRRRELHARAAELIERRAGDGALQQAELLTIHFHAACRWAETWRYARAAAEQALARAAPVEAAAFLGRALEAGSATRVEPLELARIGERQGEALRLAGRFQEAGTAFEIARGRARGDPALEAELCLTIGRLRERSRSMAQSLRWLTRGLRILADAPPTPRVESLRAQLWLARGTVRVRGGRREEAIRNLHSAARHAEASGDRSALARAYTVLHLALTELGSPERKRYRGLAVDIFEELGDYEWLGKALNNLGIDAYYSGRWDEAVELYERGRAALERVGDVVEAAVLLNNIAEVRSDQGRLDEADAQLREALAVCRAAGFAQGVGLLYANLGRVATRRGDVEHAAALFERAHDTLATVGAGAKLHELDVYEAERLVVQGDHRGALELADAILASAGVPPSLLALAQRIAGFAKQQAGDLEGARARFRESADTARAIGADYERALSLDALARAGSEDAAKAAAAAGQMLERLGVVALIPVPLPV